MYVQCNSINVVLVCLYAQEVTLVNRRGKVKKVVIESLHVHFSGNL